MLFATFSAAAVAACSLDTVAGAALGFAFQVGASSRSQSFSKPSSSKVSARTSLTSIPASSNARACGVPAHIIGQRRQQIAFHVAEQRDLAKKLFAESLVEFIRVGAGTRHRQRIRWPLHLLA